MFIDKLNDWLLSKALYNYNDKESTVVGWIKGGKKEYGYVEISGYYLTYLSFIYTHAGLNDARIISNANKVTNRLNKIISNDFPNDFYTRYDLLGNGSIEKDWRNDLLFSFDIGMVIKGLNSLLDSGLFKYVITDVHGVLNKYTSILINSLTKDSNLLSHQKIRENLIELPIKRSTSVDVHHLKTSSSLFVSSSGDTINNISLNLINNTKKFFINPFLSGKLQTDIHPTLYYVEGLINYFYFKGDKEAIQEAGEICNLIFKNITDEGKIRSNVVEGNSSYFRGDVVAQLLRATIILENFGIKINGNNEILYNSLVNNFIYDGGNGVSFFPLDEVEEKGLYLNTWVSMFTVQALKLYEQSKFGNLNSESLNYII